MHLKSLIKVAPDLYHDEAVRNARARGGRRHIPARTGLAGAPKERRRDAANRHGRARRRRCAGARAPRRHRARNSGAAAQERPSLHELRTPHRLGGRRCGQPDEKRGRKILEGIVEHTGLTGACLSPPIVDLLPKDRIDTVDGIERPLIPVGAVEAGVFDDAMDAVRVGVMVSRFVAQGDRQLEKVFGERIDGEKDDAAQCAEAPKLRLDCGQKFDKMTSRPHSILQG